MPEAGAKEVFAEMVASGEAPTVIVARRGLTQLSDAGAPEAIAARYRAGEIGKLDMVRRYAVLLDWDTGEMLPKSTAQFREMFAKRAASKWSDAAPAHAVQAAE